MNLFPREIHIPLQALMLGFCLTSAGTSAQPLLLAQTLINFNSPEGEKLLLESNARQDYFPLSIQFVTQDNLAYCGVASMVMILNALDLAAPENSGFGPYRFLILDVSRYKYPPVWVKAKDLWQAINTLDSASGQTRGFVLVSPRH